ncbi:MAG: hypothetical protein AAGF24_09495 [Cyanobacteria bacterium P01_H01_bin.121]
MYGSQIELGIATIRRLWSVVEAADPTVIGSLDDHQLTQELLTRLDRESDLGPEATQACASYIAARTALIRDLAQAV